MGLYLSPYIGIGTKADPFMPRGLRDSAGTSAVDIRLDPTRADGDGIGFALLWQPAGTPDPTGAIKLADDYGEPLPALIRNRLNTRTGLDFSADTTIQDAIETIMLRADTGRWKRLRPCRGMYEVWLGSSAGKRKWVDLPGIAGGSITDSFTRANESPVAAPWTALSGSTGAVNLSSNAITHAADGDAFLYYANAGGWNADQSSQFTLVSAIGPNNDWGPAVRIGSSGFSGYWFGQFGGGREIAKQVSGTYSSVEFIGNSASNGVAYKIDIAGTTIRYYNGGVEDALSPATDSSLTTAGNGPGVFFFESGGSADDAVLTGEIVGGGGAKKRMLAGLLAQRALRV